MSKAQTPKEVPAESIKVWLGKEAQYLTGVLCGSCRSRKYRHHIYFQEAAEVLRLTLSLMKKGGSLSSTSSPGDAVLRRQIASLLRKCVRAGESCVNELRLHRVDTIPLSLALLAILARLHALWSAVVEHSEGLLAGLRRQVRREQLSASSADEKQFNSSTIGGLVDVLTVRHIESGALQGRKRQREL